LFTPFHYVEGVLQYLASQVDGCEENVLGIVLEYGVGEKEALQKQHGRCLDLVGEAKCATHLLDLAGIVFEQRCLLFQTGRPSLLACNSCSIWMCLHGRQQSETV